MKPTVTPINDEDIMFQSFLKTGKRDKKDYDILMDERYYDNWQISFVAQARAHDIEHILDPSFTPVNDQEAKLVKQKQQFAYTVLYTTLKTDMWKTIVRKLQYTGDAQRVWYEFTNYMKQSTRAKYSASKLLTWLTSNKYDRTWKGSALSFILYWVNQALQYDAFVTDPANYLSDYQKQNFLQNAVYNVPELRQVRISCDIAESHDNTKSPVAYQQYLNLLLSATKEYDAANSESGRLTASNPLSLESTTLQRS
jgi:hypothetical protein